MTKEELDGYRRQLFDLGRRARGSFAALEVEALHGAGGSTGGNLSNTPIHTADLSADAYEHQVAVSLLENEERQLEDIAAALRRIEAGTYGRCEECGLDIAEERLAAVPYASLCIDCARVWETALLD